MKMRIRIIHLLLFLMVFFTISAQRKEISSARDLVKKGKDLDKVEASMNNLLKDSANRENEKIWSVLFESLKKQYEQGNEKLYLNQKYDTVSLFNIASRMFTAMEAYDSIDAQPDKKGRIRLDYRKPNSELLNTLRPNLLNGGLFLIKKQQFAKAYVLLDQYIDAAYQPLFQAYQYSSKDKMLPVASYWAVYCGYKLGDSTKVLHHAPMALKDMEHHELVMQYLSETYYRMDNMPTYLQTLSEGFENYPLSSFFFSNLVEYYSHQRQWEEALRITDRALSFNPKDVIYSVTKSSILLNLGEYSKSFAISDSLLQANDTLPDAYLNAGLAKFNEGVMIDKANQQSSRDKKKVIQYYREALPYLETYRKMRPDKLDTWGLPLYTIYLNLNMGKEFDEIDQLMRK